MRLSPVTGDLPAVASVPPPPLAPVVDAPTAPRPAAAAGVASAGGGPPADRRRPQLPVFDPPLIAQRAVLGLPVGDLVAGLARDRGISWSAATAMVDGEVDRARTSRAGSAFDGRA